MRAVLLAAISLGCAWSADPLGIGLAGQRGNYDPDENYIHFGAPITLDTTKFTNYGRWSVNSWHMLCDWVNGERGGIDVGGVKYKLKISYANDQSSGAPGKAVAEHMIDNLQVDFMLGPYSSGSTGVVTEATEPRKIIVAAGGAAATSKFVGKNYLFGTFVPSNTYMSPALDVLAAKHAETSTTKLRVGYFAEAASFTKGVCSGITSGAEAAGLELDPLGMMEVPKSPSTDVLEAVIANFTERNVDVVFGCTYYKTCTDFVKAAKKLDFNAKATVLGACVDSSQFHKDLGDDGRYIMGPTPWFKKQGGRAAENMNNMTSSEWDAMQNAKFQESPPYQGASAYAAPLVLIDAIEKAGSLDSDAVMAVLRDATFSSQTFYGTVKFDANMQNAAQSIIVQQNDDGELHAVFPPAASTADILFPTPTWKFRACAKARKVSTAEGDVMTDACNSHGACQDDGSCVCIGAYFGADCSKLPEKKFVTHETYIQQELDSDVFVAAVIFCGVFAAFTVGLMVYYKRNGHKHSILKASSVTFLQLMLFSHLLGFVSAVSYAVEASEAICSVRPWLLTFSLVGVFSPLFAKTNRLWRLFNNPKMKKLKITDGDIFKKIAAHLFVNCVILAFWFISDRPRLERQKNKDDHTVVTRETYLETTENFHYWHKGCTQGDNVMVQVLIAYFVGLLCYGCYMCYQTAGLPSRFNESRSIAQINYFVVVFGSLILVFQYLISSNILALATVRAFGICLGHVSVLLLLHGPKLAVITSGGGGASQKGTVMTAMSGRTANSNSPSNSVQPFTTIPPSMMVGKDLEIARLEKELAELKKQAP